MLPHVIHVILWLPCSLTCNRRNLFCFQRRRGDQQTVLCRRTEWIFYDPERYSRQDSCWLSKPARVREIGKGLLNHFASFFTLFAGMISCHRLEHSLFCNEPSGKGRILSELYELFSAKWSVSLHALRSTFFINTTHACFCFLFYTT